jgi:hypothetical protein
MYKILLKCKCLIKKWKGKGLIWKKIEVLSRGKGFINMYRGLGWLQTPALAQYLYHIW